MQTYFIGFLSGVISIISIGIFIWTIRRRKTNSPDSLEKRVSANNTDIRSGLDRGETLVNNTKQFNTEIGRINKEVVNGIENTEKSVSDIIAASKRNSNKKS